MADKKQEKIKITRQSTDALTSAIAKTGTIIKTNQRPIQIPRIPTGSMQLDFALGGGIPVGRSIILAGMESSGKTTTAIKVASSAQRLCSNCFRPVQDWDIVELVDENGEVALDENGEIKYQVKGGCDCYDKGIWKPTKVQLDFLGKSHNDLQNNSFEEFRVAFADVEGTFDFLWAQKLGLKLEPLLYLRPDSSEDAIDAIDALMRTANVDLVVLDSIAMLSPDKEIIDSVTAEHYALQARMIGKALRKWQNSVNFAYNQAGRLITQIWINQYREKIGVMFGDNKTMPGGNAQKFANTATLKFWASNYEVDKDFAKDILNKADAMSDSKSVKINFEVVKNKAGKAKRSGSYILDLVTGDIEEFKLIIDAAEGYNVIRKEKNKWFLGANMEFPTKTKLVEHLMEHSADMQMVRKFIMDKWLNS